MTTSNEVLQLCVDTFDRQLSDCRKWTQMILHQTDFNQLLGGFNTEDPDCVNDLGSDLELMIFESLLTARLKIHQLMKERTNVDSTNDASDGNLDRVLEQSTMPALTANSGEAVQDAT